MNAIIQHFHLELTREERALFEKDARLAGRRPGEHLRVVLFSPGRSGATSAAGAAVRPEVSSAAGVAHLRQAVF